MPKRQTGDGRRLEETMVRELAVAERSGHGVAVIMLIGRADAALYAAKNAGRDRAVVADIVDRASLPRSVAS